MELLLDAVLELALAAALFGAAGLASAWALLRNLKPRWAVLAGTLTTAAFTAVSVFLAQSSQKPGSAPFLQQYFDQTWNTQSKILAETGVATDQLALLKQIYHSYVVLAYPAWMLLTCFLTGLLSYYLASYLLLRVSDKVPRPVAFREWVLPETLVFGLILGGLLKAFGWDQGWLEVVSNNLLVLFAGLYILAGLSVCSFFLNRWRWPAVLRILCYGILLKAAMEVVCCMGVLDIWFDFRKIKKIPTEPAP